MEASNKGWQLPGSHLPEKSEATRCMVGVAKPLSKMAKFPKHIKKQSSSSYFLFQRAVGSAPSTFEKKYQVPEEVADMHAEHRKGLQGLRNQGLNGLDLQQWHSPGKLRH